MRSPVGFIVRRWRHQQALLEPLPCRMAAEELALVSRGGLDWLAGPSSPSPSTAPKFSYAEEYHQQYLAKNPGG